MNQPYPITPFRETVNRIQMRRKGYQISDHLLVASETDTSLDYFCIYNVWNGKRVVPNRFPSIQQAIKVAELLNSVFGDYWEISEVWPEHDIIQLAQWSVKNGVRLRLALSSLKDRDTITLQDVQLAWNAYEKQAEDLMQHYVYVAKRDS
jgi:hypothetical protein